ncbi:MAG: hypothetical protein QG654_417 [Patescibacteria group bacterium]|nr:hypothetical protein [Patescibacteria group bacterium]
MNSLLKKFIFVLVLTIGFSGIFNISKAEACQIVSSGTNLRPTGILNNYDDENRPWIYLDVKTQNCNTSPSNILEIRFFSEPLPAFQIPDHIQSVFVEVGQANTLLMSPGQVDFKTSESDFTIPILLGESGTGTLGTYNRCRLNGTYSPTCNIFVQFFNITNAGNSTSMHSMGQMGGPYPLSYTAEGVPSTNWIVGCPSGAGTSPNALPYGPPNKCAVDSGIIENVTTNGGETSGSTLTYSEEALAPLPGFSNAPDLGEFLQALFTILIVIAGLLALIMIIVGGVTYMTSDAFGKKQDGKSYIINAIVGLVLALGAWVILNTINPDLAQDLNINLPIVELGNYNVDSSGVVSETPSSTSGVSSICKNPNVDQTPYCPTCQGIPSPVQSQASNNGATPSTISKLVSLQGSISDIPWTVTEGFSPSRAHCARCHYTGTCIDADLTTAPTNQNVKAFIDAAKINGLKAQYETSSTSEFNSLVDFGLKKGQEVLLFPSSWITGSHFSVYNQ